MKNKKINQKNNTGITLIALIVTIIVLLILAGVSISLITGSNGILAKAENAVSATNEATIIEEVQLAISEGTMEYYLESEAGDLAQYLAEKFSPYEAGSGAKISFLEDGNILYETKNGESISLEMDENGKVELIGKIGEDGRVKLERTVTYSANGGTGNVPSMQTVNYKDTVNVNFATVPTREGYRFLGWDTSANAEIPHYSENGTISFAMGMKNVTLYAVWVRYGKLSEKITPEDYGKTINYSANGITDWKVFYNDGENVFLITSDYLPVEKVPTESTGMTTLEKYQVYWANVIAPSYQTVNSNILNRFKATGYTLNSEKANSKMASTLLNTNNWANFVDTNKADCVIGSPTVEMWVESWNAKGYKKLYCDTTNEYGYYIGEKPNTPSIVDDKGYEYNWVKVDETEGYQDKLYYPYYDQLTDGLFGECSGIWLASPTAQGTSGTTGFDDGRVLIRVELDGRIGTSGWGWNRHGLRPGVCLKSEMVGTIGREITMD